MSAIARCFVQNKSAQMTAISHSPANTKALQSPTSRVYFSDPARGMPFPFHSSVWMFEKIYGVERWKIIEMPLTLPSINNVLHLLWLNNVQMFFFSGGNFATVVSRVQCFFDEKRFIFRFKAHAENSELVCHHINRSRRVTDSRWAATVPHNKIWSDR